MLTPIANVRDARVEIERAYEVLVDGKSVGFIASTRRSKTVVEWATAISLDEFKSGATFQIRGRGNAVKRLLAH